MTLAGLLGKNRQTSDGRGGEVRSHGGEKVGGRQAAKRGGGRRKGQREEREGWGWCGIPAGEAGERELTLGHRETIEAGVWKGRRGLTRHKLQSAESP